ncbi:hypothetical protein [Clostridium tagluense]|uniref:NERD domain-containing protein n=1 Tax=Clostridium tagluense TaxID=360422 RepID=A0A401UT83_9CLOT|nr:hypothetical protein [Clostridium tagluense]GCD12765.1 hypothetical protein Ctaglu_43880 [Clostridium tagluense]
MIIEYNNIVPVCNQYKDFIDSHIDEISVDDVKIKLKLIEKYKDGIDAELLRSPFNTNSQINILIAQNVKDMAAYNINAENISSQENQNILIKEQNGEILLSSEFLIIIRHLKLKGRLEEKDLTLHIKILESLWNHIGNGYYYENKDSVWEELFSYAIDLFNTSQTIDSKIGYDIIQLIKATKHLTNFGAQFEIVAGRIILSEQSLILIHTKLEEMIYHIGGIETLENLFNQELQNKYSSDIDRYLIHRNKSSFGATKESNRVPYNYLINMCGKFLNRGISILTAIGQRKIYQEIIKLSSDYLTVLGLQGYSMYEDMFIHYKDLPEYIYKNIIFENLYIPVQYNPDFVLDILDKLYRPYYDQCMCCEFKFDDYYKVAQTILKKYTFCSTITFEDLRVKLGMNRKTLKSILLEISEPKEQINKSFNQILTATNLFSKPLIRLSKDTYFLVSPHFCGYSLCEIMYQILKKVKGLRLNRKMGVTIEDYVKSKLDSKNIKYYSGHYSLDNDKDKGECDVVLETDKNIIFLEIKKRSLPDTFELADDVEVLSSLGEGMLNAQKQILRHRIYLQKNDTMKLYEKQDKLSPYSVLNWKGRRIVSISICFPEYGFLTNKTLSSKFMESLLFATYHSRDPEKEYKLSKLNKLREQIEILVGELKEGDRKNARTVFFDTLFRSLQQFLYVLGSSSNVEELVENLTRDIYISDGSMDFYASLRSNLH